MTTKHCSVHGCTGTLSVRTGMPHAQVVTCTKCCRKSIYCRQCIQFFIYQPTWSSNNFNRSHSNPNHKKTTTKKRRRFNGKFGAQTVGQRNNVKPTLARVSRPSQICELFRNNPTTMLASSLTGSGSVYQRLISAVETRFRHTPQVSKKICDTRVGFVRYTATWETAIQLLSLASGSNDGVKDGDSVLSQLKKKLGVASILMASYEIHVYCSGQNNGYVGEMHDDPMAGVLILLTGTKYVDHRTETLPNKKNAVKELDGVERLYAFESTAMSANTRNVIMTPALPQHSLSAPFYTTVMGPGCCILLGARQLHRVVTMKQTIAISLSVQLTNPKPNIKKERK